VKVIALRPGNLELVQIVKEIPIVDRAVNTRTAAGLLLETVEEELVILLDLLAANSLLVLVELTLLVQLATPETVVNGAPRLQLVFRWANLLIALERPLQLVNALKM